MRLTRGEPKVAMSQGKPDFLRLAPARVAIAPPNEWPVTTTLNPGFAAVAAFTASVVGFLTIAHEARNPAWAIHPVPNSQGTVTNRMSVR